MTYDRLHCTRADPALKNTSESIMSDNGNSDNSLEREIGYKDITLAIGKCSQERREKDK